MAIYKNQSNNNIRHSESFKFKVKITGRTPDPSNAKNVEILYN